MRKMVAALLRGYRQVDEGFWARRVARKIARLKMSAMVREREGPLNLMFTKDAIDGYQTFIEDGRIALELAEDLDPEVAAQLKQKEESIERSLARLEPHLDSLREQKEDAARLRQFWRDEMNRLDRELEQGRVTVYQYEVRGGKPVAVDSKRFMSQTRPDYERVKDAIAEVKRRYLIPKLREWTGVLKDIHNQLDPSVEGSLGTQKAELERELESIEIPGTGVPGQQLVTARNWNEFLHLLRTGKNSPHLLPLKQSKARGEKRHLFRYRRKRIRVIFRIFPSAPGYVHILDIALRDDKTYNISSLVAASDAQWRMDRRKYEDTRAAV